MDDKQLCEINKCSGCGTCVSVYPAKAISMKIKQDTFAYPVVGYVAVNKDSKDVTLSSSGGAFSAIAKSFIKSGGYVCGSDVRAKHTIINDEADVLNMYRVI